MIDFHYVMRPNRLQGFIRNGDIISIVDSPDDSDCRVFMRVGLDGSNQDPDDYPNSYFQFGRHSETSSEDSTEDYE